MPQDRQVIGHRQMNANKSAVSCANVVEAGQCSHVRKLIAPGISDGIPACFCQRINKCTAWTVLRATCTACHADTNVTVTVHLSLPISKCTMRTEKSNYGSTSKDLHSVGSHAGHWCGLGIWGSKVEVVWSCPAGHGPHRSSLVWTITSNVTRYTIWKAQTSGGKWQQALEWSSGQCSDPGETNTVRVCTSCPIPERCEKHRWVGFCAALWIRPLLWWCAGQDEQLPIAPKCRSHHSARLDLSKDSSHFSSLLFDRAT